MLRLFLLIILLVAALSAVAAITATVQLVTNMTRPKGVDTMPDTFKRVAYVLLIVLLIGISSGWLGAA